jgi:hypothetical protein
MRSVASLSRRLDAIEKRLPQDDMEFEVLGIDEEVLPGEKVIVIDLVAGYRAHEDDTLEEPRGY